MQNSTKLLMKFAKLPLFVAIAGILMSGFAAKPTQAQDRGWSEELLAAHNRWREEVGLPALRWSEDLAEYAQDWAEELAARNTLRHRFNSPYGENLAFFWGRRATPMHVVDLWGREVEDYDYERNTCRDVCGHYTQIVWKDTEEVGCGVARTGNREFWVCNYNPPGNYIGERPY